MARGEKRHKPVDLSKVRLHSIAERTNRSVVSDFGKPVKRSVRASDFLGSLPKFFKAADLQAFIAAVVKARQNDKPFHLLLGAHTIKVGLSPILIDLLQRQIVTGLSFNGAGLIHDLELAFFGGTSEDVQAGLADGSFGMVTETSELFAAVVALAASEEIGLGEACGKYINAQKAPHRALSIFGQAAKLGLPVTIHSAIGTDIVCQHPSFDAAAVGAASHLDFRILAAICSDLDTGGVLANIGSAVILPEVFLKALTVARNLRKGKKRKSRLTTANFDMLEQYRPRLNIVKRPTVGAGQGYNFIGHHEIMIPLLAWGLKDHLPG